METETLFNHWTEVRQGLYQALDCLTDAQLDFVPRSGLWSLRETVTHMAGTENGWMRYCAFHVIDGWEAASFSPADYPTTASLKELLAVVHERCLAFFTDDADAVLARKVELPWGPVVTIEWIVWHVLEHEIHHRGEVFLMLGLMGMEAPDF